MTRSRWLLFWKGLRNPSTDHERAYSYQVYCGNIVRAPSVLDGLANTEHAVKYNTLLCSGYIMYSLRNMHDPLVERPRRVPHPPASYYTYVRLPPTGHLNNKYAMSNKFGTVATTVGP